jgi:hypothetical protein
MRLIITCLFTAAIFASCSSLPTPSPLKARVSTEKAQALLRRSAMKHGDAWQRYQRVEVSYQGQWNAFATKVQPILTDQNFRKASVEIYQPRLGRVSQAHSGPLGKKEVVRQRPRSEVSYNGTRSADAEVKDAAALVADAYTVFLFGSSWLVEKGSDLSLLEDRSIDGEKCNLVTGRLSPGLGVAKEDHFIAWIGAESGLLRRFQFSLNGMESTRGADVDVTFSEHWRAPDGSIWPGHFIEYIQRPVVAKAHDWRMTSLSINGRKVK